MTNWHGRIRVSDWATSTTTTSALTDNDFRIVRRRADNILFVVELILQQLLVISELCNDFIKLLMLSTCSLLKVFKHSHLRFETLYNLNILVQLSSLLEQLFSTVP